MSNDTRSFPQRPEVDDTRMHAALAQLLSAFHLDVGYTKVQTAPREFQLSIGVGLHTDAYQRMPRFSTPLERRRDQRAC